MKKKTLSFPFFPCVIEKLSRGIYKVVHDMIQKWLREMLESGRGCSPLNTKRSGISSFSRKFCPFVVTHVAECRKRGYYLCKLHFIARIHDKRDLRELRAT